MSNTGYYTVRIPKLAKEHLDRFKRSKGYPSYSQALTALIERQNSREEATEELVTELAGEASKVFAKLIYEMAFQIARNVNKPITSITLDDVLAALRKE